MFLHLLILMRFCSLVLLCLLILHFSVSMITSWVGRDNPLMRETPTSYYNCTTSYVFCSSFFSLLCVLPNQDWGLDFRQCPVTIDHRPKLSIILVSVDMFLKSGIIGNLIQTRFYSWTFSDWVYRCNNQKNNVQQFN